MVKNKKSIENPFVLLAELQDLQTRRIIKCMSIQRKLILQFVALMFQFTFIGLGIGFDNTTLGNWSFFFMGMVIVYGLLIFREL